MRAEMLRILAEVQDGSFAKEWVAESWGGRPNFLRLEAAGHDHPVEKVGEELRAMMPWISAGKASVKEPAPGSYAEFASLSSVSEEDDRPDANEMIRRLVEGQETVVRTARSVFAATERAGDEASADLLTQRMQVHEKTAWMLRSLLA